MSNQERETPEADGDATGQHKDLIFPDELFDGIPEDEREEFSRKLVSFGLQITREEPYSSDPPSHEEAAGWNALVPGTAERIFNRYEQLEIKKLEASDRMLDIAENKFRNDFELTQKQHDDFVQMAKTELKNTSDEVNKGQNRAFIVVCLIIVGGFLMIHLGHDAGGIASLLVAAASVAGIFLSQYSRSRSVASRSSSQRDSATTS